MADQGQAPNFGAIEKEAGSATRDAIRLLWLLQQQPRRTVTTTSSGGANAFGTIAAPFQTSILADAPSDTLTMTGTAGIQILTDPASDEVTFGFIGPVGLTVTIDAYGASVISTGIKGFVEVPFDATITRVTLLSTDSSVTAGSIVIDIWKDTFANYAPTVADSICGSSKPTLSSATSYTDTSLTGWTKGITANQILGFSVDSATTVTRVQLCLTLERA